MMYDHEKSDSAVVAVKPTNKAGQPATELVEPRAGAEGSVSQQSTGRAQYQGTESHALKRIRHRPAPRACTSERSGSPRAGAPSSHRAPPAPGRQAEPRPGTPAARRCPGWLLETEVGPFDGHAVGQHPPGELGHRAHRLRRGQHGRIGLADEVGRRMTRISVRSNHRPDSKTCFRCRNHQLF
jgi:hypothetical protein